MILLEGVTFLVIKSIGFPRMHKEKGEKRDFLPELFEKLKRYKEINIFVEEGYGTGMGYLPEDYLRKNPNLKFADHNEVYEKDMIVVLRAPEDEEIRMMKRGSVLLSMLHYDTRPLRNKLLEQRGIICFSMDSLTDDNNVRMLVNYSGTARSGVKVAFNELRKRMPDFYSPSRRPINVTIIGMGAVGLNAVKAFEELSDIEFFDSNEEVPGIIIRMIPRNITKDKKLLAPILKETDILVDASKRSDPSEIIIPNRLISLLPQHAIILDLSADPYNDRISPMQVKGIEGIPTGTLDKYVIEPDDELYNTIPEGVNSENRRVVVSCNAWPGVDPAECMAIYGEQILPFLQVLLEKDPLSLDINSDNLYERALVRGSLDYFCHYFSSRR
jgi:alanine dehydrogenase